MKRGFLLKAAEKEEAASDEGIRELQPPKSTPLVPQTTMPQLSKSLDGMCRHYGDFRGDFRHVF